jgi:hypothetical protein
MVAFLGRNALKALCAIDLCESGEQPNFRACIVEQRQTVMQDLST